MTFSFCSYNISTHLCVFLSHFICHLCAEFSGAWLTFHRTNTFKKYCRFLSYYKHLLISYRYEIDFIYEWSSKLWILYTCSPKFSVLLCLNILKNDNVPYLLTRFLLCQRHSFPRNLATSRRKTLFKFFASGRTLAFFFRFQKIDGDPQLVVWRWNSVR